MSTTTPQGEFSVQSAHALVKDLLRPKMSVYWADFGISFGLAAVTFWAVGALGYTTPGALVAYVVSVFTTYRAAVFIHELVHFRNRASFRRFRATWNVLCGVPLLIPVFLYECHAEHHNKRHYGTVRDAEYVPFARLSPWRIVGVVAASPLLPLFGPYRFGILTPASWIVPRLRGFVYRQASSLKLDVEYEGRPPSSTRERNSWLMQEIACLLFIAACVSLTVTGVLPVAVLVQWYCTMSGVILVNSLRLLGAHRYRGDEDEMTVTEQMLDTINYPRRPLLAELWAPVGLRLHALHHLLPGLPYHAFPAAHERLMRGFGPDSPYATTSSPSLWVSIRVLWSEATTRKRSITR